MSNKLYRTCVLILPPFQNLSTIGNVPDDKDIALGVLFQSGNDASVEIINLLEMAFIELTYQCGYPCIYIFIYLCKKLLSFCCSFQDVVGGYECECAIGMTRTNCDININDCAPGSCLNGGFCNVSCVIDQRYILITAPKGCIYFISIAINITI